MENAQPFLCTECGIELTVANGDRTCPDCGNQMVLDLGALMNSRSARSNTPESSLSEQATSIRSGEDISQSSSEDAGGGPSGTNSTVEFQLTIFPTARVLRYSFTSRASEESDISIESTDSGPPPLPAEEINQLTTTHVGAADAEQQKSCTICCEDFRQEESVCQLPCSHLFHQHCAKDWLGHHGTCPNCRLPITAEFAGSVNGADDGDSADTNQETRNTNGENVEDGSGGAG